MGPKAELALLAVALAPIARSLISLRCGSRLNRRYTLAGAVLLGMILLGHVRWNYFPFVVWNMYGRSIASPVPVLDVYGIHRSGRERHLVPSRILPSMAADRFSLMLRRHGSRGPAGSLWTRDLSDEPTIATLLSTLAGLYNRRHSDDPITAVYIAVSIVPARGVNAGDMYLLGRSARLSLTTRADR